jgi:phosphohistidine phosphatase
MKTLLILRHAKSSWKDSSLSDHERPLNKRGKKDAPRMGELLYQENLLPDLVLSSDAKRAQNTAQMAAEASGYDGEIFLSRDLYSFSAEDYLEALAALPDEYQRVMVVGHNPGLEELLEELTGDYRRMSTAALAQVRLPIQRWAELNEGTEGQLVQIWRPKEL